MTIPELDTAINEAVKAGREGLQIVGKGTKTPLPRKGWPRPELLCVNTYGNGVWLYKTKALKKAFDKFLSEVDV